MRPTKPSSSMNEPSGSLNLDQPLAQFDSGSRSYHARGEPFSEFALPLENQCFPSYLPDHEIKKPGHVEPPASVPNPSLDWDPRAMLSNLSFLEQKIHQVQDIVRSIVNREGQFSVQPNELAAQQQLVTADLTCIIIQLISTAGSLLPSIKNTLLSSNPSIGQLGCLISSDTSLAFNGPLQSNEEGISSEGAKVVGQLGGLNGALQQNEEGNSSDGAKPIDYEDLFKGFNDYVGDGNETIPIEDHDVKDSEDGMDGEHLPPGSYEILQLEKEEILAPHTHFCTICGKGFKRDANLRMHMRGHGDEYKTPAALAKPTKESSSEPVPIKRYSCPFTGCKRNKEHRKFQPLKTILCVKNHYKRSHCDKSYICSRCNSKRFSVIADLKTHEKHCGRDKWLCSCGTTFSRKDKLFGHVALFQGHTPALPMEEAKGPGASDQGQFSEVMSGMGRMGYNFTGNSVGNATDLDIKGVEDDRAYFSPMNLDSCNFGGLDEFPRAAFELSESPFSFLPLGSCNFVRKNGENLSSSRLG